MLNGIKQTKIKFNSLFSIDFVKNQVKRNLKLAGVSFKINVKGDFTEIVLFQ